MRKLILACVFCLALAAGALAQQPTQLFNSVGRGPSVPLGNFQQGLTIVDPTNGTFRGITTVNVPAGFATFTSATAITLNSPSLPNGSSFTDTGNGTFLFGGAGSATPTSQAFTFQPALGTNIAGATSFTITGPPGTGTGAGGNFIYQAAYPGTTGAAVNTGSTVLTILGNNTQSSGTSSANSLITWSPTVNQSGTAGFTGLKLNVTETATGSGTKNLVDFQVGGTSKYSLTDTGVVNTSAAVVETLATLTYGTTIATNAALANFFNITIADGVGFTLSNPTNPSTGQRITWRLRNTSGGAAGTLTFGAAFKTAGAFTQAANGNSRTISFIYDGTNWVETGRGTTDVAN
jgi:hypothetical protein